MNITGLCAPVAAASRRTRVTAATALAALAVAAMASAAPSAHAATAQPATTAAASRGIMGEFHCGYGQVILDYLNVTPGTGPVYYTPEVWVYYSGAWHFYGYGQTETLYSSISFSSEWPIPVSVPHGYYYAVNVGVSSSGVTQTVSSYVDAGAPIVNAGYCAA